MITRSSIFTVMIVKRELSDARDISIGEGVTRGRRTPKLPAGLRQLSHGTQGFALHAYIYIQRIKHMQLYFTCIIYIVYMAFRIVRISGITRATSGAYSCCM